MISINSPCKDCTKRILHCHATCERYKGYEAKCREIRDKRFAIADEYEFLSVMRSKIRYIGIKKSKPRKRGHN